MKIFGASVFVAVGNHCTRKKWIGRLHWHFDVRERQGGGF